MRHKGLLWNTEQRGAKYCLRQSCEDNWCHLSSMVRWGVGNRCFALYMHEEVMLWSCNQHLTYFLFMRRHQCFSCGKTEAVEKSWANSEKIRGLIHCSDWLSAWSLYILCIYVCMCRGVVFYKSACFKANKNLQFILSSLKYIFCEYFMIPVLLC